MPSTVTGATQSPPVAEAATSKPQPAKPQPQSAASTPKDTVQIGNAAKAALQEATETPSQTAQEARSGDHQAQKLQVKEAAAAKAYSAAH